MTKILTNYLIFIISIILNVTAFALSKEAQIKSAFVIDYESKILHITIENADLLDKLTMFPNLEELKISCLEDLKILPKTIGDLKNLKYLNIDNGNGCVMNVSLPENIINLKKLQKLKLYGAVDNRDFNNVKVPRAVFPKTMFKMTWIKSLDLGRNGFDKIPGFVFSLSSLEELYFDFNDLKTLPDSISQLKKLKKITLGDNYKITLCKKEKERLKRRFPKIIFDFENEYD